MKAETFFMKIGYLSFGVAIGIGIMVENTFENPMKIYWLFLLLGSVSMFISTVEWAKRNRKS